jgi:F-type H+-transporting ATPase subunit gamma
MPSIQDLRRRIRAVRNMQQVTRAMKMVSAARLRRAQERVIAARPYANRIAEVLSGLADRAEDYSHPLLEPRGDDHVLLVLLTADRGLCGAFNSNLVRATHDFIRHNEGKEIELLCVGRKGRDYFRRRAVPIRGEYIGIAARQVDFEIAQHIAHKLVADFLSAEETIDRVVMVYNEFKSVARQQIVTSQLLPIVGLRRAEEKKPREVFIDYLYEQPPGEILGSLLPRYVESEVFRALLESAASEHAARMMAMENATNNAQEMISTLTLQMNQARQATITKQILEVVSGAAALEEVAAR